MRSLGDRARRAWWYLPPLVLLAWLFRGVLAGEAFAFGDNLLVFYPLKKHLAGAFALGVLPEWWPFDALGQPLASLPIAGLFHPTTLLYAALPFPLAFSLQTLLPLFLAPVGTWAFARSLGLARSPAALAVLVVAVSYWHVLLACQTQMYLAAAALPWFWREVNRCTRGRHGSPIILALATANMALAGDPMLLQLAAIGALAFVPWRRLRWRRVLQGLAAGLLGLGLGAVQLWPMLRFFPDSPRATGLNLSVESNLWSLTPAHLAGLVWPTHHGSELLFDTVYVGAPTLVLALLGLSRPWRYRWPLLGLWLGLVLTAFGPAFGPWRLWSALVPGWSGYQFPVKTFGPAVLPLALLAGRGFQLAARRWAWPAVALSGAVLVASGVTTAILQLVAASLGFLRERHPEREVPLTLALLFALGADVAWHLGTAETRPFAELETPTPVMKALAESGVGLEDGSYEWSWAVLPQFEARFPDWKQHETELMRLVAAPDSGAIVGLPSTRQYLAGITRRVYDVSRASREQDYRWRVSLSQVFGARARVQSPTTPPVPGTRYVDAELGVAVVALPGGLPRAYFVTGVVPVAEAEQVARLSAPGFRPGLDVLVAPGAVPALGPPGDEPPRRVPVKRSIDRFELELEAPRAGLLVVNEAFAAGWEARVDGEAATLVPANHAVLGVPLAPGRHRVELEYHAPGLRAGAVGSALCLLAVLGWAARRRRAA